MGMAHVPMDKPGPDDPVTPGYRRPVEDVIDDIMGSKSLEEAVMVTLGGADGRKFPEVERIGNALVEYVKEHYVSPNTTCVTGASGVPRTGEPQ